MQVSEILRVKGTTLYTTTPDTMLSDCVVTMADHDIGSLIVMDKGRIVEQGSFRALSKANGLFAKLLKAGELTEPPAPRRKTSAR